MLLRGVEGEEDDVEAGAVLDGVADDALEFDSAVIEGKKSLSIRTASFPKYYKQKVSTQHSSTTRAKRTH